MGPTARGHILVWTRDTSLAARFCRAFEQHGFSTSWAAALHEAIRSLELYFPHAVTCTLEGEMPSLMDLETLLVYASLGHRFISLPPPPIWALTSRAAEDANRLSRADLAIHAVAYERGVTGLVDEVAAALGGGPGMRPARGTEGAIDVLLIDPDDGQGECVGRYLRSRGVRVQHVPGPDAALAVLQRGRIGVIVTESFTASTEEGSFLERLSGVAPTVPILVVTNQVEWLRRVATAMLPRNVAATLAKPVNGRALEACLRRLLRRSAETDLAQPAGRGI